MPAPREMQIDLNATPYYHCMTRCVRRAFLCGHDPLSKQSFEHRRDWIIQLFKKATKTFAIDVCAYAIMSNHYHLVLRVNKAEIDALNDQQVIERWAEYFTGSVAATWIEQGIDQRLLQEKAMQIKDLRKRLCSISWFMRAVNEKVARRANEEDDVTGKFWEARFKSQALLDETALFACMAYVDLNPIRAKQAKTPETSDFTAIQERITCYNRASKKRHDNHQPRELVKLQKTGQRQDESALSIDLESYFELVDTTGRMLRDKKGHIPEHIQPILTRLNINPINWIHLIRGFEEHFQTFIGRIKSLNKLSRAKNLTKIRGTTSAKLFFNNTA